MSLSQKKREISANLETKLRALLQELRPTTPVLSILLVHIAQLEPSSVFSSLPEAHYESMSSGQREQIFTNVRRVIRLNDQLCLEDEAGGAFAFPDVDPYGVSSIVERVYQSVSLLQAETILPPLSRETTILLACGSLSASESSLEQLFFSLSRPTRQIILRPALLRQFAHSAASLPSDSMSSTEDPDQALAAPSIVPFLDLPRDLPPRLKQLLPYPLARELCCAPVGRDQHRLTVAMATPHNSAHIQRLSEATGMTIFPVSCEIEDLDILLATKW
jgi:Type II secretion system (T2SS), protein E, N-terminal domain